VAMIMFAKNWLASKLASALRLERGQTAIEYVLMILVVVLFLIAAALLLQGTLSSAVSKISSWINAQSPP
jgi:Flp pilus assembly pilin Flp